MGKIHYIANDAPGSEYPSEHDYLLCDKSERFNDVAATDEFKRVTCKNCIRIFRKREALAAKGGFYL